MTRAPWNESTDLPEATTWLLEASAGTGKTFQIAGLFLRLVAEYGVAVERILAITFTNAATSELRDRIRARLAEALALLRTNAQSSDDPIFARVLALSPRERTEQRLQLALRSFDLAAISTIHGFSQRMLQELAFDSAQDAGLTLANDARDVIEQLVDDTLAALYADASADEVSLFENAGMHRARLRKVAKATSGPSAPIVCPAGSQSLDDARAMAQAWVIRARTLGERLASDEGQRALAAIEHDVASKLLHRWQQPWAASSLGKLAAWVDALGIGDAPAKTPALRRLSPTEIRAAWKGDEATLVGRPYWALCLAVDETFVEHRRFVEGFAPLAAFAHKARARIESELARRSLLTFDAMLSRLAERVAQTGGADSAIATRIRERFDVVFVDEFQDTDDAQWRVIEAAFHGKRRLFLIGDPKQAIYAFRGADVHVYLQAASVIDPARRRTMVRNWRSDPAAVEANNVLFREGSDAFDQKGSTSGPASAPAGIDYVRVQPEKKPRLVPTTPGLSIRWVDGRHDDLAPGTHLSRKSEPLAAKLAAREAVAWLNGERGKLIVDGAETAVMPGDLAVLVNGHYEASVVREALRVAGIPSVAASKSSVFASDVARWLAHWLDAVAGGGRDRNARTAAVTPLFGWRAEELAWALAVADRGDDARALAEQQGITPRSWESWVERLAAASERWSKQGFARTFDLESTELGVLRRLLALPNGERQATDLRHLFELLHVHERTTRGSPQSLADWLRQSRETESDETAQRLESDARAVKIETVHASKGLEYPIVLLPFAWSARSESDGGDPFVVRGEDGAELHVGTVGTAQRDDAFAEYSAEQRREGLRRLYVALTRGRHHTLAWYGPIGKEGKLTSATPLGRLLMRDPTRVGFDDATMPDFETDTADAWQRAQNRLDALAARSQGTIVWAAEPTLAASGARWSAPTKAAPSLELARWPEGRGGLFGAWVITSYTDLVASLAERDRDEKLPADAPSDLELATGRATAVSGPLDASFPTPLLASFVELPRLQLGGGTGYGTWVHGCIEQLDFASGTPRPSAAAASLPALLADSADRIGLPDRNALVAELAATLPAIFDTPLDGAQAPGAPIGIPAGFRMRDIADRDRIDELAFDLRIGAGTAYRMPRSPGAPAAQTKPIADPGRVDPRRVDDALASIDAVELPRLASWIAQQRARRDRGAHLMQAVAGILTGSIDLVFRTHGADGPRYFLADYKTNRIASSRAGHYASAWLDWEMVTAGYPLQALIYTVALHRHLRARLGDRYDYERHVGGYLYLFVRGMAGASTPRDPSSGQCLGVLGHRWPAGVVEAFDAALDGQAKGAS